MEVRTFWHTFFLCLFLPLHNHPGPPCQDPSTLHRQKSYVMDIHYTLRMDLSLTIALSLQFYGDTEARKYTEK